MKFGIYTLVIKFEKNSVSHFYNLERGWGNGYVLLPPSHPYYGFDYDNIGVYVHGGLTFGIKFDSSNFIKWIKEREIDGDVTIENFEKFNDYWIIGFDTGHHGDNKFTCPKEYVMSEVNSLLEQCLSDDIKGIQKYKAVYQRKDKLLKIEGN